MLWNQQVQTDRTIPNNKPDIIIRDNEKVTYMLIDVAISGDRNVIKKEAEEILEVRNSMMVMMMMMMMIIIIPTQLNKKHCCTR